MWRSIHYVLQRLIFGELPSPLDRLQALSMGKAIDLKLLFEGLISQFGFGKISSFKASNIQKRIPKYSTVKISDSDMAARSFYRGKYSGYSDEDLSEVLRTDFFQPEAQKALQWSTYSAKPLYSQREDHAYNGKLLHYRQIDDELQLPPGTSKRLLISLAHEYGLVPGLQTENVVRFNPTDEMWKRINRKG